MDHLVDVREVVRCGNRIAVLGPAAALMIMMAFWSGGAQAQAQCNIALNGSFESPNIQTDPDGPGDNTERINGYAVYRTGTTPISGWQTVAGTRDILRHYNNASEGMQSIDLYGVSAATLRQTFTGLIPGQSYAFSIDYSGNSATQSAGVVQLGNGNGVAPVTLATLRPVANSVSNGTAGIPTTPAVTVTWSTYQHTFTAAGTEATIQFVNTGISGGTGLFIDNFTFASSSPCETDLAITKDDGATIYTPGDDVTYTIVVTNNGPVAVTGARVSDPLPPGITSANWTCGGETNGGVCGAPGNTGAIDTTADLPVGASVTYTLTLAVPGGYTGDLTNTATVAPPAGVTDSTPDNDSASDTNAAAPPPTASSACSIRGYGGSGFTLAPYGVIVGTSTANVVVQNGAFATLRFTDNRGISHPATATTTRWFTGNTATVRLTISFSQPIPANWISLHITDVGNGGTAAYNPLYQFAVAGTGTTATTADFAMANISPATSLDYFPASGAIRKSIRTQARESGVLMGISSDLVRTISLSATDVATNDNIGYILVAQPSCITLQKASSPGTGSFSFSSTNLATGTNVAVTSTTLTTTAPNTAVSSPVRFARAIGSNVTITEAVPTNWNLASATCFDQNASRTGNPASFGALSGTTLTIPGTNVRMESDIRCLFTNEGTSTDLGITKDDGVTTYTPGLDATYTITATNNGPNAVAGARITDPLPANITDASWVCSAAGGGACIAPNGVGGIDTTANLPVGASVTYTLSMRVPASYSGNLTNTATVAPPAGVTDTNSGNDTASDTDTMEAPPASTACSPRQVEQGDTFTLAPLPVTGTVQKSAAEGWQAAAPWATNGGNYTFTWTFAQPVPVSWLRFAVVDVNDTSGTGQYTSNPPTFTITLGAGSTATPADFALVPPQWPGGSLLWDASAGALRFDPSSSEIRQHGYLQGTNSDTVTSITITASGPTGGDNITNWLFVRPACMTVEKMSQGGTGSFTIDLTNVGQADGTAVPSTTLTTTAEGTAAVSPGYFSRAPGTNMTLSEVVPAGWGITSAVCTDRNAANTGNPTVVGSFATPTLTIAGNNVRPEADIVCRFNNGRLPALALTKTTRRMAGGPFGFALGNTTVTAPGAVTTAAADSPVAVDGDPGAGTAFTVAAFGADVTIEESSLPAGWILEGATCTNGAGAVVGGRSDQVYTIPAGSIAVGETYACDFVNTPTTNLRIDKTANPTALRTGETVTYAIAANNDGPGPGDGAVLQDPAVTGVDCSATTLTCSASGGAVCPASLDVAALQGAGLVIPTFPAGGALQFGMACTVTATGQ